MNLFKDKVVMVTGAGGGIGRAAALLFAQHGARVCITDIHAEPIQETVALIEKAGGEAIYTCGDITDVSVIKETVDVAVKQFGRLDCAFNNAGITHPNDHNWDDDAFEKSLAVNLTSVMQCIKYQVPQMLKQGKGSIVNTASIAGLIGAIEPNLPGYTSSKHAVIGLTKTAAMKWASQNIRVNAILPGVTMTKMVEDVMASNSEAKKHLENMCPMGRVAQPEEMAEGAIWLCSDKASYVNGHSLVIDGGVSVQ